MSRSKMFLGLGLLLILAVLAAQSFSQDQPQQGRGRNRGQGGQTAGPGPQAGQMGQRDPEQMRQMMEERMLQRVKQNLNATDEQWAKIEPPLKKVMTLSQQTEGMGMGFGGRGMGIRTRGPRPGGPEGPEDRPMPEPETKLDKARLELRTALDNPETKDLQKKLDAFRAAREEARKELAAAQKELKKVLTLQQEAELVLMGYLD